MQPAARAKVARNNKRQGLGWDVAQIALCAVFVIVVVAPLAVLAFIWAMSKGVVSLFNR